jgi:transcription initiation factor IIE alpha subunit
MKAVLFCHKYALAFPQLPATLGFTCPQCGEALKVCHPLSKRQLDRFSKNLGFQIQSISHEEVNQK